jgi:hypothetical protein
MGQALQHGQPTVDDGVIGATVEVSHHANTTGVMLIRGVVETGSHVVLPKRYTGTTLAQKWKEQNTRRPS